MMMMESLMQLAAAMVEQVSQTTNDNEMTDGNTIQWSQSAKAAAAKVVLSQLEVLTQDLEAFARYAVFSADNSVCQLDMESEAQST